MLEILITTSVFLILGCLIGILYGVMQKPKIEPVEPESEKADAENIPLQAVILCSGTIDENPQRYEYCGVKDCRAALALGDGGRHCADGCIGLGSCAGACPEKAIVMRKGLAVVDMNSCTGCGECIGVCPRNLIVLRPRDFSGSKNCVRNCPGGICGVCMSGCREEES